MKWLEPGRIFIGLALLFGGLFIGLTPPFQSPDEPNHFLRAYQISEGQFFPEKIAEQRLGGYLPASLQAVTDSFAYLKNDYAARLRPGLLQRTSTLPLLPNQGIFLDFANTAVYAPMAYLPQAVAIALLRPLGVGPLGLLYATRLANLLIWILLIAAALRALPALHRPVAALALLPASLVMAASANADVLTNGLCFWLFAVFCQPVVRGKLWSMAAFMAVCAAKVVTWPLGLLYGLHPKNRRYFGAMLAMGLVAAAGWGWLAQNWFIPYDAYDPHYRDTQTLNEGVQPMAQLQFIATQPFDFLRIAAHSYMRALPSTLAHFVGKFGWEKNYLPTGWIVALWLVLLSLICCESYSWTKNQRGLAALVGLLFIILFSITMYALWCPVGAGELTNLQGRYFVPIAPVLALAVSNRWLAAYPRFIWPMAMGLLFLGNAAMVWAMLTRWWL